MSTQKSNNKRVKILAILISATLFLLVCGCGLLFFSIFSSARKPLDPGAGRTEFTIHPGQGLKAIALHLEQDKIISSQLHFTLFAKFKRVDKRLQAGEYEVSASQTPADLLDTFVKGRVKLYRITLPEGVTMGEIAAVVEAAGFCEKNKFLDLCRDRSFIQSLGIKSISLEGYLFPDTYFFPKKTPCEKIITTMVEHFKTIFTPAWQDRSAELDLSVHDIVTLASIIEKETGDAAERPLIASVFHNRLAKNMRLESDPTVIYGIKDFDGNIKRKHLKMITPYNTYQIRGLPMGPIANPGSESLSAALYPAQTQYLFFVSKKDTTHQFSRTIQEHNQAVKRYQLQKR